MTDNKRENMKAKTMWWEGEDLHIVNEDGTHVVLQKAYIESINIPAGEYKDEKGDTVMTVEPVNLTWHPVK